MFGEADWWKLFWELDDLLCCMIVVGCMHFGLVGCNAPLPSARRLSLIPTVKCLPPCCPRFVRNAASLSFPVASAYCKKSTSGSRARSHPYSSRSKMASARGESRLSCTVTCVRSVSVSQIPASPPHRYVSTENEIPCQGPWHCGWFEGRQR